MMQMSYFNNKMRLPILIWHGASIDKHCRLQATIQLRCFLYQIRTRSFRAPSSRSRRSSTISRSWTGRPVKTSRTCWRGCHTLLSTSRGTRSANRRRVIFCPFKRLLIRFPEVKFQVNTLLIIHWSFLSGTSTANYIHCTEVCYLCSTSLCKNEFYVTTPQ